MSAGLSANWGKSWVATIRDVLEDHIEFLFSDDSIMVGIQIKNKLLNYTKIVTVSLNQFYTYASLASTPSAWPLNPDPPS